MQEVDPFAKRIKTTAGELKFDEAILMPPHQAADMVWHAGLIGKDATTGKPTGWADMHQRLFHANGDDSVYFVGDLMGAISPQFGHYPKSGHVANYIGRIVAETKRRPLFLVGALHGFDERSPNPSVVPIETAAAARGAF